jgi:hypothetical protein
MFIVLSLICFPTTARSLLDDLPHGILDAANGILNLAGGPLGLAVRLQLGIAHHLLRGIDDWFSNSPGSANPPLKLGILGSMGWLDYVLLPATVLFRDLKLQQRVGI